MNIEDIACLGLGLIAMGMCFWVILNVRSWQLVILASAVGFLTALLVGQTGMEVYNNLWGECAHAPKLVPYHEGMTLCPGQKAIMNLPSAPAERNL